LILTANCRRAKGQTLHAEELARRFRLLALESAQLESIFTENDENWGDSLAAFHLPRLQSSRKIPMAKVKPVTFSSQLPFTDQLERNVVRR